MRYRFFLLVFILLSCAEYEQDEPIVYPPVYFKLNPGTTIKTEIYDTITLDARQPGFNAYQWKTQTGLVYDIPVESPVIVARRPDKYTVIYNNGQDSSTVEIYELPKYTIPDYYYPDRTFFGVKQEWVIVVSGVSSYNVSVFSNENIKVYEFEFHSNMTILHGWDGTYMGEVCPPGCYYYYFTCTSYIGREYTEKGYLNLIR